MTEPEEDVFIDDDEYEWDDEDLDWGEEELDDEEGT